MFIVQKIGKKSAKERSNGHDRFILGFSLVSKIHQKNEVFIPYIKLKSKIKAIFRIILIFVPPSHFHRTPRPSQAIYSYKINSCGSTITQKVTTLYLTYKRMTEKKLEGGHILPPPPPPPFGVYFFIPTQKKKK